MKWMMAKGTPHFRTPPFLGTFRGKTGKSMVSCRFSLANPLKCGKSNGIDRPFLEDGFCHSYKWWFLGWFMALTILVGGFNPLKKYESQLRLFFPMYGKKIFQTTKQYWYYSKSTMPPHSIQWIAKDMYEITNTHPNFLQIYQPWIPCPCPLILEKRHLVTAPF